MKKNFNYLILLIFVALVIIIGLVTFIMRPNGNTQDMLLNSQTCEDNDGTWLAEFNECEYIGEDICLSLQGVFNECASACRHLPEDSICTLQCIPVCSKEKLTINSFEECVEAGLPVLESYPAKCIYEDQVFVQYVGNEMELFDNIRLDNPRPSQKISSPLQISGQARGTWFFEANFPVILTNWDGLIIAEGYAQSKGEWMTEEFVPFTAELIFEKPEYKDNGALILQKANPSGLPEHDDALEIPVYFQ